MTQGLRTPAFFLDLPCPDEEDTDALDRRSQQHLRMHNKLRLADRHLVIIDGRNPGDEYFDVDTTCTFTVQRLGTKVAANKNGEY